MEEIKRIVLSGAPGTGKTTILNLLKKQGYKCMEEVSREIIAHELAINSDVLPWKDLKAFSKLILKDRIEQYKNAVAPITIYDRSIIDTIAYLNHANYIIDEVYNKAAKSHKYSNLVFICPLWEEIYTKDNERHEDYIDTLSIHESIVNTYSKYGYKTILIPKDSPQNRVNFILNTLHL